MNAEDILVRSLRSAPFTLSRMSFGGPRIFNPRQSRRSGRHGGTSDQGPHNLHVGRCYTMKPGDGSGPVLLWRNWR